MHNRFRNHSTIRCNYLHYRNPSSGVNYRLPMLHVRLCHGGLSFTTVALIDSGATTTFVPTAMAEALQLNLSKSISDAVGAGGVFPNIKSKLDSLELVKGKQSIFDQFNDVTVKVPTQEGAIPYMVLGRDLIFKRFDIKFEERNQKVILKRHGI